VLAGLQAAAAAPVTTVGCSATDLANAVSAASSGATLSLQYDCTYYLTTGLAATVSLTIDGNADTIEPAAGSGAMTMLSFATGTTDSISSLTMTNGNGGAASGPLAHDGGAIANDGTLTIDNSEFTNNTASGGSFPANSGGAIINDGTLTIDNTAFIGNHAAIAGGAIVSTGPVTLADSTFRDNVATTSGAAIYSDNNPVTATNCDFIGNSGGSGGIALAGDGSGPLTVTGGSFVGNKSTGPDEVGGAIEAFVDTTTTIRHVDFRDNSATEWGGAIYTYENSPLTVADSAFSGNTAGQDGGAIYADDKSALTLSHNDYTGNSAGQDGGAIYASDSDLSDTDGVFEHNTAAKYGGAVAVFETATGQTASVTDATFRHNAVSGSGGWGGAIYVGGASSNSSLSVGGSAFADNTALLGEGGAIWTDAPDTYVTKSSFDGNEAENGGAVLNQNSGGGAVLGITDSKAESNRAREDGGALDNGSGATAHLDDSLVTINLAGTAGGGIYNLGTVSLTSSPVVGNHPDNCAPAGSVPGC
jgi:predicted outer membrane repeat protein